MLMMMLEPVVRFVGQLSFSNKLRLTVLVFGFPLLVAALLFFYALNDRVADLDRERAALAIQVPALALISDVHQYSAIRLALDEGAVELEPMVRSQQEKAVQSLQGLKAAVDRESLLAGFLNQKQLGQWASLEQQIRNGDTQALGELAITLRGELEKLNEDTGLLIDGDAANSRLLDVMTTQVPRLVETTGRAAQIGSVVLVKKSIRGSRRSELTVQRGNFDALVQWSMEGLQKVALEHPQLAAHLDDAGSRLNTAYLPLQEMLTIKMLDTSDFDMTPEAFLALTAKSFGETLVIGGIVANEAEVMLLHRLEITGIQRNAVVASMIVGFLLLLAGFISAYISIMRGINGLSSAVDTMASGDLDARAEIHTSDEIGKLALQFNDMAENLAQSSKQLREKSHDIQGMLQNLPQGILTLVAGGTIHPEYSAYLETIFETREIAGRAALDFLFDGSDAGTDSRSQVEAAVFACLGEDRMNFEFNQHLLLGELQKTLPDGRVKILEMDWSPICDENDNVEKIMVCVRDITEFRQLAAAAEQQKRELEMIGQILKINQEKFHAFIDSARDFISANDSLLQAAADPHPELITQLFRNMHTIKGNARTYGLLHLTNVVHEAEQAYDELRKNPEAKFDKAALLAQLQGVAQLIDEYSSLNDITLGRKGPGRRGSAEKYVMVPRRQVDELLVSLNAYDLQAVRQETLAALLAEVRTELHLIGTEPIRTVLDGVFESLPSLARELGKEAPQLQINDNRVFIKNQMGDLLRNVFMHLYRNSMDHGIELPAERLAKGKPAAGTIQLDVSMAADRLLMRLKDDGKGLALGHIRRKGIEKGLIAASGVATDEAVAMLIFAAGFSTATAVTEVSGRGVGMDAVQDFIKREGGTIQIALTDQNTGADFRNFEMLITLPAHAAVMAAPPPVAAADGALHAGSGKPAAGHGHLGSLIPLLPTLAGSA